MKKNNEEGLFRQVRPKILSRYLMPVLRYTADGLRRPGVAAEKWLRLALDQLDWHICINRILKLLFIP